MQNSDFLLDLQNHSYLPSCWTKPVDDKPSLVSSRSRIDDKLASCSTLRKGTMTKLRRPESEDERLSVNGILKIFSQV